MRHLGVLRVQRAAAHQACSEIAHATPPSCTADAAPQRIVAPHQQDSAFHTRSLYCCSLPCPFPPSHPSPCSYPHPPTRTPALRLAARFSWAMPTSASLIGPPSSLSICSSVLPFLAALATWAAARHSLQAGNNQRKGLGPHKLRHHQKCFSAVLCPGSGRRSSFMPGHTMVQPRCCEQPGRLTDAFICVGHIVN